MISWAADNERKESKLKQRPEIEIPRKKGLCKGRPLKYCADVKNPKDRMTYQVIINKLQREELVKKFAKEPGVKRDPFYRIKKIKDKEINIKTNDSKENKPMIYLS